MADEKTTQNQENRNMESKNGNNSGIIAAILGAAALIGLIVFFTLGHYQAKDEAAATASFRATALAKLGGIETNTTATKMDTSAIIAGQAGDRTLATIRHDALRTGQDTILASTKVISDAQDVQGRQLDDLLVKADAAKVVSDEIRKEIERAAQDRVNLRRKLREDRKAREAAKAKGTPYRFRSETTVRYVRAR